MDDLQFYPCPCGYQVCRFCWHRIRTDPDNGLCPQCRSPYRDQPDKFTPVDPDLYPFSSHPGHTSNNAQLFFYFFPEKSDIPYFCSQLILFYENFAGKSFEMSVFISRDLITHLSGLARRGCKLRKFFNYLVFRNDLLGPGIL